MTLHSSIKSLIKSTYLFLIDQQGPIFVTLCVVLFEAFELPSFLSPIFCCTMLWVFSSPATIPSSEDYINKMESVLSNVYTFRGNVNKLHKQYGYYVDNKTTTNYSLTFTYLANILYIIILFFNFLDTRYNTIFAFVSFRLKGSLEIVVFLAILRFLFSAVFRSTLGTTDCNVYTYMDYHYKTTNGRPGWKSGEFHDAAVEVDLAPYELKYPALRIGTARSFNLSLARGEGSDLVYLNSVLYQTMIAIDDEANEKDFHDVAVKNIKQVIIDGTTGRQNNLQQIMQLPRPSKLLAMLKHHKIVNAIGDISFQSQVRGKGGPTQVFNSTEIEDLAKSIDNAIDNEVSKLRTAYKNQNRNNFLGDWPKIGEMLAMDHRLLNVSARQIAMLPNWLPVQLNKH